MLSFMASVVPPRAARALELRVQCQVSTLKVSTAPIMDCALKVQPRNGSRVLAFVVDVSCLYVQTRALPKLEAACVSTAPAHATGKRPGTPTQQQARRAELT